MTKRGCSLLADRKPFMCLNEDRQASFTWASSLKPLMHLAFLCVEAEEVVREGFARSLEVAVCRVNTTNYGVPVQPWTRGENQCDHQIWKKVIGLNHRGLNTGDLCFWVTVIFLCSVVTWPWLYFPAVYGYQRCGNLKWKTFGSAVTWASITHLTILEQINA